MAEGRAGWVEDRIKGTEVGKFKEIKIILPSREVHGGSTVCISFLITGT